MNNRAKDLFEKLKKEGNNAIEELILNRKSEELFLDFKRSSDNGVGKKLSDEDKNNLAKAISGFGNSEGGVIIWGVYCFPQEDGSDVASQKYPIVDVKKYVSLIESAVSGLTIPPHAKVENHIIQINKKEYGYVVTYIPPYQLSPIQSINKNQFYIRAGSNFVPTPYQVLAGMFGKQPRPYVYNMYTFGPAKSDGNIIYVQVGFLIHNEGPGIARDIFLSAKVMSSPGPNCEIYFETPDLSSWTGGFSFGRFLHIISKQDIKIAPDAQLQPVILNIKFSPPFNKDLKIDISCGCEGSPPMKGEIINSKELIELVYEKYIKNFTDWTGNIPHKVVSELLGLPKK